MQLRQEMRENLKALQGDDNSIVQAVYSSPVREFCDVENVLFYNVGSGAFRHISKKGVAMECHFRNYHDNHLPDPSYLHHYSYLINNSEQHTGYWQVTKLLSSWNDIHMPVLKSDMKPEVIWYAMKKGVVDILSFDVQDYYGIDLTVTVPRTANINIVGAMKPLLDGIISAFHYHNGESIKDVSERLQQRLGLKEDEAFIEELLLDETASVLGIRNLVMPYRQGIVRNPGDDQFVRIKIEVQRAVSREWKVSGSIYGLKEANQQ